MQEINIEKIMEEIRRDIVEKGYKETELSFQDIPVFNRALSNSNEVSLAEMARTLGVSNSSWRVNYYRPIEGRGIKKFIKRVIRKLIKPVVLHMCEEQEQFNASVVQTMNTMSKIIEDQQNRIHELEQQK